MTTKVALQGALAGLVLAVGLGSAPVENVAAKDKFVTLSSTMVVQ